MEELKAALIRFQINLTDKEIKVFLQRLDEDKKGYISQSQFMKKFWAAYTYDDLFANDDTAAMRGTMTAGSNQRQQGISDRMKKNKMFSAIQQKLKMVSTAQEAFRNMDKGVGFLTVKDIIAQMPALFGISLKRDEFLKLFKEIDSDKDGIVKY